MLNAISDSLVSRNPEEIAARYNHAINHQDLKRVEGLIAADQVFMDSEGNVLQGRDSIVEAWCKFFIALPDYQHRFDSVKTREARVIATGRATCSNPKLEGRFIWTCRVESGRVKAWMVYHDTEANRSLLAI